MSATVPQLKRKIWSAAGLTAICGGLYLTSLYNYLLFHSFVEFISIAVAFALFMIAWSARTDQQNSYIIFVGIAYLFVGFLDLTHTLAYEGMRIFTDYDYYANQLWIAARFMESCSLLAAFLFLDGRRKAQPGAVFGIYVAVTAALLGSIFVWRIFPECYVAGQGLTPFKKGSEYLISAILLLDIVLMVRFRALLSARVYRYMVSALVLTIGSELAFTFYESNYGFSNLVGHYFKLFSFYCIYKAIVETCLTDPFHALFRDLKQSEDALRSSAASLNEAQRIAHLGSWTYHIESDELFWSDEIYRIFGLSPQEFGATYEAFLAAVHPDDREAVDRSHHAALRNEVPHAIEHRVVLPDGSERVVREQAEVFFAADGRPVRMVGTVQDITDRRRAEDALDVRFRYEKALTECSRVLLSASPATATGPVLDRCLDVLLQASEASRVYFFENFEDAADGLCMRQRGEACADGVSPEIDNPQLQHLPYAPSFERWREELASGSLISGPVDSFPEGERCILEPQGILSILVLPVFVRGHWHGFIGFDDTVRVRPWLEEDIRLLWMTAEMLGGYLSLQRLQRELTFAKEEAEEANRTKSVFLANMSHEIRTPMNAVIGMNQLAMKMAVNRQQRHYLETVQDSANSLLGLLNDILDFSKMEAGQLAIEAIPFDLRRTMESTVRILAVKAHEKGLELLCHLPAAVPTALIGDPLRLRQILLNLVGNAVKFTERGHVVARVEVAEANGEEMALLFCVEDTGIGVAPERREIIFERFSQEDSGTARFYGGSGLGLSICKRLAELMGGRIWVADSPGGGTSFNFILRCRRGVGVAESTLVVAEGDCAAVPVLVAAEHPLQRKNLTETFGAWGFSVTTASTGERVAMALTQAADVGRPVRFLVADRGFLGDEVLATAAAAGSLPRPTVIAMVPTNDKIACGDCAAMGIDFCLTKPVARGELRTVVEAALAGKSCQVGIYDAPKDEKDAPVWTPLRILLAEDTPVSRELAKIVLEDAGHTVTGVGNGLEALAALAIDTYDVVIMDVQMPRMDGLAATAIIRRCEQEDGGEFGEHTQLAGKIRQQLKGRRLPIFAMTAHAMSGDRERCLAAGMDDYITKPFQVQEVLALLHGLTERHNAVAPSAGKSRLAKGAAPATVAQAREQLQTLYGLSSEKIDFLLDTSKIQLADRLDELEGKLVAGDMAGVVMAAHALVGLLANLGFADWATVARQIEQAGKSGGDAGAIREGLRALQVGIAALL